MSVRPARASRLMFQLPDKSRLMRLLQPVNNWGWQEMFLNQIAYHLQGLLWQNANMGVKKSKQSPPPKMWLPDFIKDASKAKALDPDQELHTVDEIKDILSRPRRPA